MGKEIEAEKKKDQVLLVKKEKKSFEDLISCFMDMFTSLPETPFQEYVAEKRLARLAQQLLPNDKEKEIRDAGNKLKKVIKESKPQKRETTFKFQDFAGTKYPVYKMVAKDAGESHAKEDELKIVLEDFKDQQYENATSLIVEAVDEALDILTDKNIIPIFKVKIKDIIDKRIKKIYNQVN